MAFKSGSVRVASTRVQRGKAHQLLRDPLAIRNLDYGLHQENGGAGQGQPVRDGREPTLYP